MVVSCSRLELFLGESHSLKEKRQILKSIIERVKNKFNVSIIELDDHDLWQKSTLGISYASRSENQARRSLNEIECFIEHLNKAQVINNELFFYSPER